jgi:hypothetical protein
MPDSRVSYQCECGKHWNITPNEISTDKTLKCECGRTIVVQNGFIYSTNKPGESQMVTSETETLRRRRFYLG